MSDPDATVDAGELPAVLSSMPAVLSSMPALEVTDAEVLHDGLNRSVLLSTAADGGPYVLRQPRKFRDTALFNDLRTEYEVLQALEDTDIPTPKPVSYCADESVLGDPFFLVTYLEGTEVPLGEPLPERFRTAPARGRFATTLIDTMAEIHTVDCDPFAEVCERRSPRAQLEAAVDRIEGATQATGFEPLALWSLVEWLREAAPANPERRLVHGDYRPGNVLFAGDERPRLTGVLDWESAFLGDPRTELGYLLLRWGADGDAPVDRGPLEARYSAADLAPVREVADEGLAPFTTEPGSPSREELVARYEAETGIRFDADRYYRVLAAVLLAAVWADLHRERCADGRDSSFPQRIDHLSLVARSVREGNRPM
ncbi:MAG: phosphotransferase family protein [Halopenitus sp.]